MSIYSDKTQEKRNRSTGSAGAKKAIRSVPIFQFVDNRPETNKMRKLQELMNNSQQVKQLSVYQALENRQPDAKQTVRSQAHILAQTKPEVQTLIGAEGHKSAILAGAPPVQRVIKMRSDLDGQWGYYSDRDPDQILYSTPEEAQEGEDALGEDAMKYEEYGPANRPPTMYTYAHIHPTNKMGNVPQGPHVVAYSAVDSALNNTDQSMRIVFDSQVRPPTVVGDQLRHELAKVKGAVADAKIERFIFDYTSTYNYVSDLINSKGDQKEILHYIKWLVNADHQSSTNWKQKIRSRTYKTPQSKIGGKNESRNILDRKNVDTKSSGRGRGFALYYPRRGLVILDQADNVFGANYVMNDPAIRNMGECFWDSLNALGATREQLDLAAAATNTVVNTHVSQDEAWSIIQSLNAQSGSNHGLTIDVFNIDGSENIQLKYGNQDNAIRLGFMLDPDGVNGHFVPEEDRAGES